MLLDLGEMLKLRTCIVRLQLQLIELCLLPAIFSSDSMPDHRLFQHHQTYGTCRGNASSLLSACLSYLNLSSLVTGRSLPNNA